MSNDSRRAPRTTGPTRSPTERVNKTTFGVYEAGEAKNAKSETIPLRGWLLRVEARATAHHGDHEVGIVQLTRAKVAINTEGKAVVHKEGEVAIVLTKQLQELKRWIDPETVFKVELSPFRTQKLANGSEVSHYTVTVLSRKSRDEVALSGHNPPHSDLAD